MSEAEDPSTAFGVEQVSVDAIDKYQNNPKENEESIELLKESIPKFGFKVPVVLDEDNVVVAGHARVGAVRELQGELDDTIQDHRDHGHDDLADNLEAVNEGKVWALRADGLTPDEIREFRVVDNRVGELSSWDDNKLQFELREIEEAVGFDDDEIEDIIAADTSTEVTTEDIEDAEEELDSHFEELAEDKSDRKSRLPCPNCDSWIYVDVEELERALVREGVIDEDEI